MHRTLAPRHCRRWRQLYLREDFYTDKVCLDGEDEEAILVGLFKRGDELVGMWSWEQEPDALTLYASSSSLHRSIAAPNSPRR